MFAYHLYKSQLLGLPFDMTAVWGGAVAAPPAYIISKAYSRGWIVPMSWNRINGVDGNWLVLQGGIWNDGEVMTGNTQHTSVISANASRRVDTKIDDGKPLTGSVEIIGYAYTGGSTCETAIPGYTGSCIGYNTGSGIDACASSNTPSTATYINSNTVDAATGCKLAFRGF